MKKNKLYYFKRAFLMGIPIAAMAIVYYLFSIDLNDTTLNVQTIIKGISAGLLTGLLTGLILGIRNIFAKVETLIKSK